MAVEIIFDFFFLSKNSMDNILNCIFPLYHGALETEVELNARPGTALWNYPAPQYNRRIQILPGRAVRDVYHLLININYFYLHNQIWYRIK